MNPDQEIDLFGEPGLSLNSVSFGRYALMPGDPGRAVRIAEFLESPQKVGRFGGVVAYSGRLNNVQVSVISTGIGGPTAAILVEELSSLGVDTFIRVGTSGTMQSWMQSGDLVVAIGAVRDEGTSRGYLPLSYPAAANPRIVKAFTTGCLRLGYRHHVGIVHSKDSLYGEWESERMPVSDELQQKWKTWIAAGVLCSEMELAAIMIAAAVLRKRAGGLLVALNDDRSLEPLCKAAVCGLKELIEMDQNG